MKNSIIYVTRPSLPPLEEYISLLEDIWETGIISHNGPMLTNLEKQLEEKLGASNTAVVTNGTTALQIAIKALELQGEVITTPFSWIATISAIKWQNCTPVFCDIEADTFNIDPSKIEPLITEKTVAIMPVHVFGVPCNVEAIEKIAKKYNLKVIYDAAHALGSTINNKSVLEYGDISATSLHCTKIFNSGEGGACFTNDKYLFEKIKRIRFFGHNDSKLVIEDGFNGKMTELHAALGLANLKYFDDVLADRYEKYQLYLTNLKGVSGLTFQKSDIGRSNYSYFPLLFDNEATLLHIEEKLNKEGIIPRRYFYPSLNTLIDVVQYSNTPISENISKRVLCLPLHRELDIDDVYKISNIIAREIDNLNFISKTAS